MKQHTRSALAVALSLTLAAGAFAADKAKKADKSAASRYPVPASLRGFDGTLAGTVVSVQDHMRGFVLKITQIAHVNARSTATDPNSAVGKEVEITPSATKDKSGHSTPDQREINYIKSLEKGQSIQIDVINTDPSHLRIANLTTAEKQQAKQQKKSAEKDKD